jgi:NAD(P)-dependent dehydrogenase (short-subunit alcohol dehydrogenase family)
MSPTVLITGAASGLGKAISMALNDSDPEADVIHYDKRIHAHHNVVTPSPMHIRELVGESGLDILINCAGVNKINWLQDVPEEEWDQVMSVNAKGIFMMSQVCLPYLKQSKGTILNIVSNAAHMPMRCSLAYNASKGAALIMTKQLARELTPQGITVFSVSPNKLAGTGMSDDIDRQVMKTRGWSLEETQRYQRAGLLTGEETPVERVAEFIAFLLSSKERHKYLSGCDIPYGA